MKARVKKSSKSASTIPHSAKLRMCGPTDVGEESGGIVTEPVSRKEYDLSELLKGITPENLHEEVDW